MNEQIFMFHYAGGNQYSYLKLAKLLEGRAEVHCLELPGRGKRIGEPLVHSFQEAVDDYVLQIRALRNGKPYTLYGHSMGGLIAPYIGQYFYHNDDPAKAIVVTGSAGPEVGLSSRRYLFPREAFVEYLISLGGIPQEVLEHEELLDFFLPIIRADFELLEKEKLPDLEVNVPLFVRMGTKEKWKGAIENWENYSKDELDMELIEGDHFFIEGAEEKLVECFYGS
jgi:external thioesterase TEII